MSFRNECKLRALEATAKNKWRGLTIAGTPDRTSLNRCILTRRCFKIRSDMNQLRCWTRSRRTQLVNGSKRTFGENSTTISRMRIEIGANRSTIMTSWTPASSPGKTSREGPSSARLADSRWTDMQTKKPSILEGKGSSKLGKTIWLSKSKAMKSHSIEKRLPFLNGSSRNWRLKAKHWSLKYSGRWARRARRLWRQPSTSIIHKTPSRE